jgi:hypothetical protein
VSSLTVKDVSRRYGVTAHSVLCWIKAGELRALNVSRRPGAKRPSWRITPEALQAFEERRTPRPVAPQTRRRKRTADIVEFYPMGPADAARPQDTAS